MLLPRKKKWAIVFVTILILIFLANFIYRLYRPEETGLLRQVTAEIVFPLEHLLKSSICGLARTWQKYLFLVGLKEENLFLREQNETLTRLAAQYAVQVRELDLQVARLQKLLQARDRVDYKTVAAQVIGQEKMSFAKRLIINRGINNGIKVGMPVITPEGLVGRVTDTSWNLSRVMSITDPLSKVDALVQETRLQGVLYGAGGGKCQLKYVPQNEVIQEGKAIITSGLCGVFPKGLILGYVKEVSRTGEELFQEVSVRPAVNFLKLEEVLVLVAYKRGQ